MQSLTHAFSKNLRIVDTAKQCPIMYQLRSLIINFLVVDVQLFSHV